MIAVEVALLTDVSKAGPQVYTCRPQWSMQYLHQRESGCRKFVTSPQARAGEIKSGAYAAASACAQQVGSPGKSRRQQLPAEWLAVAISTHNAG
jgi:hypothetical protein